MRTRSASIVRFVPLLVVAAVVAGGCRQGMFDQARKEAYEASDFFVDGASSRPLPEHTVARGQLREDRGYYLGTAADGTMIAEPPMPVDRALLLRGRKMYEAYCSMCHDRAGTGNGMVVQRGFPQPPTYHQERLRAMPAGYFVNVMTVGFGRMPSYAVQIDPADRWAIAAYVKVLQAAQAVPVDLLPPEARVEAEKALLVRALDRSHAAAAVAAGEDEPSEAGAGVPEEAGVAVEP